MTAPLVQNTKAGGSSTSPSCTINNVTPGNFVLFLLYAPNNPAVSVPADSNGALTTVVQGSNGISAYFVPNAAAGTHKFTCSLSLSENWEVYAAEFQGTAAQALDLASAVTSGTGTAFSSASITPAHDGDLVVCFVSAPNTPTISWNGSLTGQDSSNGGPTSGWAWAVQETAAPVSSSGTLSFSETWHTIVIAISTSALNAAAADTSMSAGAITTGVKLAAAATDVTTAAGVMGIYLYANAQDISSASASLTAAINAAAAMVDSSSIAAALTNWSSVVLAGPLYVGNDSIVGPLASWSDGAPAAGNTVYYDGTYLTVESDGEIIGTINGFTALCQWLPSPGVQSDLTVIVTPGLAGYANMSSLASAAMTTAIQLMAAAQSVTNASASLISGTDLDASISDVTSAAANLATVIELAAQVADNSIATGTLSTLSTPLSAAAEDDSSITATLNAQIQMAGAVTTLITSVADLATRIEAAGSAVSFTSTFAYLTSGDPVSAVAVDQSQASASLWAQVQLAAPMLSIVKAAGILTAYHNYMAALADATSASGSLSTGNPIAAASEDVSSAAGELLTAINTSADVWSTAAMQGVLSASIEMQASIADSSSASASLGAPGSPVGLYTENPWFVVAAQQAGRTAVFPSVTPASKQVLTFDLSSELVEGEELNGNIVLAVVCSAGSDTNPNGILLGPPSYDPTQKMVEVPVGNCLDGCDYYFTVTAPTTNEFKTATGFGLLQCRS